MTDIPPDNTPPHAKNTRTGGNNFWIDFGPILVFVLIYQFLRRSDPDGAIYLAAVVFMGVALVALAYSRIKTGRFSPLLLLTTIIIVVTVGLAYVFRNPIFIYMKPTMVNAAYGVIVFGGLLFKKNAIKVMMGEAFELPEKAWNNLAVRWGVFFFAMAILNEIIWRNFSEPFWVKFKLLGFLPLTLLFGMSQVPFLMKHGAMKADGDEG